MFSTSLALICFILLLPIALAALSLAPWVPTKKQDLERISQYSDLKPGQIFLEMGCGDGRVCTYIARKNPEAQVIGIELALWLYVYARIKQMITGPKNLKIIFGNALKHDFSVIDVLYVFGLPETVNKKVKTKVIKEMKPGAKLISYIFTIKDWPGTIQEHQSSKDEARILVYQKKSVSKH